MKTWPEKCVDALFAERSPPAGVALAKHVIAWLTPEEQHSPMGEDGPAAMAMLFLFAAEDLKSLSDIDPMVELGKLLSEAGLRPYVHFPGCMMQSCGCRRIYEVIENKITQARTEGRREAVADYAIARAYPDVAKALELLDNADPWQPLGVYRDALRAALCEK